VLAAVPSGPSPTAGSEEGSRRLSVKVPTESDIGRMRNRRAFKLGRILAVVLAFGLIGWGSTAAVASALAAGLARDEADPRPPLLRGRVVAVGIVGASAISPVAAFQPGGEFYEEPDFAAFTRPGQVLDPDRLLVASSSNFGAPRALPDWPAGAILSIDPTAPDRLVVPPDFAATGGQAAALDGAIQLFTAQSPPFVNAVRNPDARTAALPAVSNPRGITINNAFGRPWFASAPFGALGPGTVSAVDPDGRPRPAVSRVAGGVFAGEQTNHSPQVIPGALVGAVSTAFLGVSPDDRNIGVYAAVNADGSVVQVHVGRGVDGLAPAGTIGALPGVEAGLASTTESIATRTGVAFNWVPDKILYLADPVGNALVALTLIEDELVFRVEAVRRIEASQFDLPIDLAPAVPEVVSRLFASNTTLAGRADLYVANRGNGTIARLRQDGTVLAVHQVEVPGLGPLGAGRLNGIAVSPDAQKIFVTISGSLDDSPSTDGAVLELPAFYGAGS
jgi:hypothetical protein